MKTELPEAKITPETSAPRRVSRQEVVFHAARTGHFSGIQLTPEDFALRDESGNSLLHEASWYGAMECVPRPWPDELLILRNQAGQTPHDLELALDGHRARMRELRYHACHGGLAKLQVTAAELDPPINKWGDVLALAAGWGHINEIPIELRTPERMERPGRDGVTPAWLVRERRNPDFVEARRLTATLVQGEPELGTLTLGILTIPTWPDGWTLAHSLAYFGLLPDVPRKFLSFEVLSQVGGAPRRTVYQVFKDRGPDLRLPEKLRLRLDPESPRRPFFLDGWRGLQRPAGASGGRPRTNDQKFNSEIPEIFSTLRTIFPTR